MNIQEKINLHKTLPLSEQLDDWFGKDTSSLIKGLCYGQCISNGKTVAENMCLYELSCYNQNNIGKII